MPTALPIMVHRMAAISPAEECRETSAGDAHAECDKPMRVYSNGCGPQSFPVRPLLAPQKACPLPDAPRKRLTLVSIEKLAPMCGALPESRLPDAILLNGDANVDRRNDCVDTICTQCERRTADYAAAALGVASGLSGTTIPPSAPDQSFPQRPLPLFPLPAPAWTRFSNPDEAVHCECCSCSTFL